MKNFQLKTSFTILLLFILTGCNPQKKDIHELEVVELKNYQNVISYEDEILATPVVLRYESDSTLFVYDQRLGKVFQLKENGEVIQEYGRRGRGPGEFQRVHNIFVHEDYLYVIDPGKYSIHKFDRLGELISTMNYGEIAIDPNAPPPPPMAIGAVAAKDIDNLPVITPDGNVLLTALYDHDEPKSVYKLTDWEGNILAEIGDVPDGSTVTLNNEKMKKDVLNRVIPTYYRPNAFPVMDKATPGEFFFIYSAFPKIARYNLNGDKLWEVDSLHTPQIDSATTYFFEKTEEIQRQHGSRFRLGLEHYVSGVSSPEGDLFLAMDHDPLWIDQFNPQGKLIRRYKLVSEGETTIEPVFDIDFENNRFLIVSRDGDIRAYSF